MIISEFNFSILQRTASLGLVIGMLIMSQELGGSIWYLIMSGNVWRDG